MNTATTSSWTARPHRQFTVVPRTARHSSVTVTITGTNDAPGTVSLDDTSIADGAHGGDVVGLLTAADMDARDTHIFTLTDADGTAIDDPALRSPSTDGKPALVVKRA